MSLVSVVVGTYNGSKFIEEQLQSIINQTYSNIEIIITDDASTDNTLELVREIAAKHPFIKVHAFEENLGYIKNFERGIALAKGELIALSDQDDWWYESKIAKLVDHIGEYDLVYCDSMFTDENLVPNGSSFSKSKYMINSKNPIHFLIDNCVSGHAMLFKRDLYEKAIPFSKAVPHDWWLTYYATLNDGICYLDEALIKYRFHDSNVIAANKRKMTKVEKQTERRERLKAFYHAALRSNHPLSQTVHKFHKSYKSLSLVNNIRRAALFSKHKNDILAILRKSEFKKVIFCLNMFFKLK